MTHLLAVLGLAAACALWAALQPGVRDAARGDCDESQSDCARCGLGTSACRSAAARRRDLG